MTWQQDFEIGFLKVEEGEHELIISDAPLLEPSNFGADQWVFRARLDGTAGKLAPSKRLGALISQAFNDNGEKWPVTIRFRREGMDLRTRYIVLKQEKIK